MTALRGTCLCGAVSFVYDAPEKLVRCNCAACQRYGTLWAHGPMGAITVTANGPLTRYVRTDSDGDLAFVSCATCGVTTHWEPTTGADADATMAVNAALSDPADTAHLRIRHFDGADSWRFLD